MKFCVSFLLLLLFDTLQGSTLSHVRKVRSLNTTLQTNFNGTYERRNPCTNAEIESSSYIASHEFQHHTCEDNWSDYTHKCSAIISGFLQAIGNLVRFNNKQNGLFNFHINTSISQKQAGDRNAEKCRENMPTILIEATDCQVTPRTNTEAEGKYDGPVCLLNKRNKASPKMVSQTTSCEQNADTINPPIINSNQKIPQNEFQETEQNLKQAWNPIQTSLGDTSEPLNAEGPQIVLTGIAPPANEQTSEEIATSTTSLSQSEPQIIPVTTPQPNFDLGNSPGFQATPFENANEQRNFNPPADIPNMPFAPQPSFNGIPPQPVVPISNEEQINQNQLPPVLPNQQGLPTVYPPQPSNDNLDRQVPGPSYPDQMSELLPPSQAENIPQGGPGFPQNSPAFIPTYNAQNPNLQFPGNYPSPPQQTPPMKNSFELPPTDFNNDPPQVGFTETQASGQISDMTQTVDSFTPDHQQQQPVTPKQTETAYYNDGPMNYNQAPTVPSQEIQPKFLPPKPSFFPESQQKFPQYPSEIATNEQSPMRPVEVLPSDSVDPKDAAFSDSPVFPNGNLPVAKSFEPVIPPNSQLPIAPALTSPQDRPFEQQYTTSSSVESTYQSQREGISEFQVPPNQMPGPSEMYGNPPIPNQPAPNTFIQPVPAGNIPYSNNFPEQARNEFDGPQQPDSTDLRPVESTPFQPIPTLGPQPSPDFTQQLPRNEMFGPVPQNFQGIVPVDAVPVQSSPIVGPTNDIASQTAMEDSKFDYPTSTERPEEYASDLVTNSIGNQLSELTTNNKPVFNSNDFQPETQSYFTEPFDRKLHNITQTPFYDSIPGAYKSESEFQPGVIPGIQNLPERPITPAPEQAFPPSGLKTFPVTPKLPIPTPDVTSTEPYSEQIGPEFGSTPTYPEFVNPTRNGFQMFSPRPNPRFIPREQYLGDDRQAVAMQQPNPIPKISNPIDTNQLPLENSPVVPEQQQPRFYPNQNGDNQQSFPESAVTSQPSAQMATQQEFQTTGPETNEFPSSIPLQDQPFTAVYPQPPIQPRVPNYDVQSGNQAQVRPDVPNYDIQPGNQAPIQPGIQNYEVQSGNQPPIQPGIQNYDVQPGNQSPIQPGVQNYDVQSGNQSPIQPGIQNYDVQSGNQPPIQPDVPNYDVQQGFQAPIQPDIPNYDVQPGNQAPMRPDVPNYDVQSGNQAQVRPDVPNYDVQPGNQPPVQPGVPNFDVQQGFQAPIQPDIPNYDVQPGNQPPIQPVIQNYDVQQGFQAPIQPGVQNYDVKSGNQPPIRPDVPNYDIQPGNQAPIQPGIQNYEVQPGNQSPIQPVIQNYDVQSGNQPPIQPDVPNYDVQQGFQAPIQPDIPNYDVQPGNQAPMRPDVPNYDVQPGNQSPIQPGIQNYDVQPGRQPPNAPIYYPEGRSDEFYPEQPQNENQPFQADPQSVLPYQAPTSQIPSAESQEQIINPEIASAKFVPNTDLVSTIPPAAPGAGDSFPNQSPSEEQQSAGFDGSQMPQQNYPNPGFPSPQAPVYLPATQATAPQYFPGQSNSNLNYDAVQPEQQIPGNDQFPPQTDSNLQPVTFPPQIVPMSPQNGVNPNEFQTFVPSAPPQETGAAPFPNPPLQTIPENYQINSFPVGSETSAAPEVLPQGMNNVLLNPNQPSGVSPPELQDPSTQDQFTTAVPPQFTTESSGEVTTDYPDQYRPRPSEDNFSGVPGVRTTNQMITSIDEYQNPGPTTQEPLSYFQERSDDVPQTTTPSFQADQFLTSTQYQSEYVQNNAAMYSPNLAPRPQPQPSFDNLTEFPGDKTAGSTTQTPLPSEIKPETFGSQPPRQTALTETNIPDTDNTKTLDTQPNSGTSDYLSPQIYANFDVPAPAVNYPRQDRRSFPPTADSITRDMTYQTTIPAFTSSLTVPTYGINPTEMVFNSNSSYSSTAMIPGEGLEKQPFRQASALIASPQPQPTTVKYKEQIIIPQYQMPTASNPQPQASLKYADQNSGNNTKEGLLDSVAWTYPDPQEAMGSVSQPQYQTTPLMSQFPPSNVEFNNENIGRPFLPGQKQLVPITPSFEQEDSSNGKTTTKIVQEVVTTDFPVQLESPSSVEDQLSRADKLLNSNTRIQEYDQRMGQGPQIQFPPTKTRPVTESFIPPLPPFQYPLAIQNQPRMQTSSLTSSEQIDTDSPTNRPSPFQEDKIQVLPQFQSFPSKNITVHTTDSLLSPPPTFQQRIQDQPEPQRQSSSTDIRKKITDSPITSPLPFPKQFFAQPQTQHQQFSSTVSREIITNSLVTPPPPFQSQIQDRPQQKLEGFAPTNFREVVTEPKITIPSPFEQQTDAQPQPEQQFSSTTSREVITDFFVTPPPPFQPQTEDQTQPQLQSFPSTNTKEIVADSSVNPPLPLPQQINVQTKLQPYSLTISRERVTDTLVGQPAPFQPKIEDQPQPRIEEFDSTNIREDTIAPPFTAPPSFQQDTEIQPQTDLQVFPSTNIKKVAATSTNLYPKSPFPKQIVRPLSGIQYPTTTMREDVTVSAITPPPSVQQQTHVQPQPQLQSFPSTNMREIIPDRTVSFVPPNQQIIVARPQFQFQSFPTNSVVPPPPFERKTEIPPKSNLRELDSTNIREDIVVYPVTPPSPIQQKNDVRTQTELQQFSSTISEEIVSDSLRSQPHPLQPQIGFRDQLQLEEFDSTNISEDIAKPLATPPAAFRQESNQLQTELQPFPSTNSREVVTDSLVTPQPPFEPQVQSQRQLQPFRSTNIKADMATTSVVPVPPFLQQIVPQPRTQLQYPTTIKREDETVPSVSLSSSVQQQTVVQPQPRLQSFPSTNMREIIPESPVIPPPQFPQQIDQPQTELRPFSSTISRKIITDSLVTPPPPFQPQIEDQFQPQAKEFYTTNIREDTTTLPITRPSPFQPQIVVPPQLQFQSFPSTSMRVGRTGSLLSQALMKSQIQVQPQSQPKELDSTNISQVLTEPQIITPSPFEQQTDAQPPSEQQFSSTTSREVITDSFVTAPPPFELQNEDQTQPQLQTLPSTDMREIVADSPVIPSPLPQQINIQTKLQPYSLTISRERVTDTLMGQPTPFQPQIQDQPQPQVEEFDSTNIREDTTALPITRPSPFQPQIQVPPQSYPEGVGSTNMREDVAVNPVTPPPPFQQENDVQPQTDLQPFSATMSRETVTDSLLTPPPPVQSQIVVQPQVQFQSFPLTNIRVVTTNSPVPPPPFEGKTEMRPQADLEGFESTNIREVVTEPSVVAPPPVQQQNDAQPQTVLQPYFSSTSRELITDAVVTPPSRFQPQIQVRPQQQFQLISSTNTRKDISDSPVTVSPVFEHQTNDLPQTQLQPLSSTMSKEIVSDSLVSQSSLLQPQNEVHSEPQFLPPSPNMRGIMSESPTSQPPPAQQLLQNQLQPRIQLISSRKIMTGPLVRPPRPFPRQMEVQPQPELKTFSSVVPAVSYVYPSTPLQEAVETQRQRDLRNFPSRNITAVVSNSPVGISRTLQGASEQVQSQMHAFPARNREVAIASLPNPAAKLGKNVARELQTQRTRYTTTKTKEVITESILPTSNSVYVESGKDGQLKAVEIRSDSKGNHGKKKTEVVEETIASDFPPATEFSSLEDEFILADKLLNNSTPVLNTTSYVKVSPLGGNSEKVITIVDQPMDQISVKRKSENLVPLSKSTSVNYNPKHSQSGLANKPSSLPRGSTVSPDFQTSERDVFYSSPMSSDYQDDFEEASQWNPLLHTLETHLNFPLHEPAQVPSTTPGPRRASPLPLLSHFYPTSPIKTRRRNSWPNLEIIKNSRNAAQEMKTGPWHDPLVPVSKPIDPSNGPDPLKELILKNHDLVLKNAPNVMAPGSRRENF